MQSQPTFPYQPFPNISLLMLCAFLETERTMSTAKNLRLGPTGSLEIQEGWGVLSLPQGVRKEGGEGSIPGHLGEGRVPSGAMPSHERSLSFLASGISADLQWLGPGCSQTQSPWGEM